MNRQSGITSVEFAIVAVAFFTLLFGAFEMSRLLFTWNTLDSITQRTARMAAVCPIGSSKVKQVGMYGSAGNSSPLPGFTAANLQINYLDDNGNNTSDPLLARLVEVRVVNYEIDLAIPFVSLTNLASPPFHHVVSAESLGWNPDSATYECAGA